MFINESSRLPGRQNESVSVLHEKRNGGTIINIITAVIFFGIIALGVMWVMKQTGEQVEQYGQAMVNTQNKATTVKCQTNLRAIWQNIQMYAVSNDKLPESFEDFVDWSGNSRLFQCPEPNSPKYAYIPGQRLDSPGENILIYEPEAVHNGGCNVLRVNGTIELITFEELQADIKRTRANLQ
jgi:hypothetical protein